MSSNTIINGNALGNPEASRDAANTNYIYIEGHKPLTKAQKRQLTDLHVEIYEYVDNNTYLCRYEPSDIHRIQELDFIARANVYHRRLKTTPNLDDSLEGAAAKSTFTVDVVLHKGPETAEEVAQQLVQDAGIDPGSISVVHRKIRITTDADTIAKIRDIDRVKGIEEVIPIKLYNNVARKDLDGDPVTIKSTTYEGSGEVVAIADTGFDLGSVENVHPAFTGRVLQLYAIGRPADNLTNDFNGHGTHCAGSILGDGKSDTMGGQIQGVAPKAKLVLQSLLTEIGRISTPPNLWDLFEPPYTNNNARVASNSWGPGWGFTSKQLPYDNEAEAIDSFVYQNPDHVIVFAGGNDGEEKSATNAQIGSSSAAKNIITVGATQSSRPNNGNQFDENSSPGDPSKIAKFSSRGPTIEKRIKPDLVAPGVAILSASSRDPQITDRQRNSYGPTKDQLWAFSTGTSMATPLVAGCAAVVREALIAAGTEKPSAALVKALLINGAVDIGLSTSEQGFGRVDLIKSLLPVQAPSETQCYVDRGAWDSSAHERLDEEEEWTKEFTIPPNEDVKTTLKVTLAYSDRKGAAIQNNLTLKVKINDTIKRGDEGQPDDSENNVEQVVWDNPPAGAVVTLTVYGERMARPDDTQSFALVWRLT